MKKTPGANPVGRPNYFEGKGKEIFEKGLRAGLSQEQAAFNAGVTTQTVRNYLQAHPEARERWAIMKEQVNASAKEVIAELIRKKDAYTARWYLEKTDPAFSQKIQSMNINVNVAEELTEEQKQAIASRFVSNHGTDGRGNNA